MLGGGQEQGLRPGTLPVPLIAGFGEAAKLALRTHGARSAVNRSFRETLLAALAPLEPTLNGDQDHVLPHAVNLSLAGIEADRAITALKGIIAVSSTSACTSHTRAPSHVLTAMGLSPERVETSLRLSWCHLTPAVDWDEVVSILHGLRTS